MGAESTNYKDRNIHYHLNLEQWEDVARLLFTDVINFD